MCYDYSISMNTVMPQLGNNMLAEDLEILAVV